jgi:single-strand DNA-binding protein
MASVNKVILVGNVGQNPELRYLESGVATCGLRLATSETMTDRKTGDRTSRTEWHNVVLWRQTAEFADKYVRTGSLVYIEGRLRTRSWTDKLGIERQGTEIVADQLQLLERKGDAGKGKGDAGTGTQGGPVPGGADDLKNIPF